MWLTDVFFSFFFSPPPPLSRWKLCAKMLQRKHYMMSFMTPATERSGTPTWLTPLTLEGWLLTQMWDIILVSGTHHNTIWLHSQLTTVSLHSHIWFHFYLFCQHKKQDRYHSLPRNSSWIILLKTQATSKQINNIKFSNSVSITLRALIVNLFCQN